MASNSAVLGPIWPNFELVRDVIDVLVTCEYEEDPIKNEGARVVTTLYSNFSDAQGQITLVLVSVSGRNSITRNYVVSVRRGFFFLSLLMIDCVISSPEPKANR